MLFDSFVRQRGNWKVLESALQHSKFVNQNGAKMFDALNVNKLTQAQTKMEVGKLLGIASRAIRSRYTGSGSK